MCRSLTSLRLLGRLFLVAPVADAQRAFAPDMVDAYRLIRLMYRFVSVP